MRNKIHHYSIFIKIFNFILEKNYYTIKTIQFLPKFELKILKNIYKNLIMKLSKSKSRKKLDLLIFARK